ncbi:MAG: hypothetical protein DHS20C08_10890 [Rhodomicrobium sp.]|nr:MAG: hypothetical protein DHS20C08_10890 [Rhodomicrobium sp.]
MRKLILLVSHLAMLAFGFSLGIYALPILTAPPAPDLAMLEQTAKAALYNTEFKRDLKGSDFLHWGEGKVSVTADKIVHMGKLAPGPDYKLYLTKTFVEDEAEFEKIKQQALRLGDIKTFDGFITPIPEGTDLEAYTTLVIWCEAFGEFITAAKYR